MSRSAHQRQRICSVFARLRRPLSVAELRAELSGVAIATLYRNIKGLLADGLLFRLPMPGQASCFAERSCANHAHFYCRICRKVYCLPPCRKAVPSPPGFEVEGKVVWLVGLCSACNPGV